MAEFFSSLVTPAVVAGLVTLAINNRSEKVRARRDFVTKAFDPARDDIRGAVDAAIEYYPLVATERTPVLTAKILASEREVRRSVSSLIRLVQNERGEVPQSIIEAFDDFIASLTTGSFQASNAASDLSTAIKIAETGSRLRSQLTEFRSLLLQDAIEKDFVSSFTAFVKGVWIGVRSSLQR